MGMASSSVGLGEGSLPLYISLFLQGPLVVGVAVVEEDIGSNVGTEVNISSIWTGGRDARQRAIVFSSSLIMLHLKSFKPRSECPNNEEYLPPMLYIVDISSSGRGWSWTSLGPPHKSVLQLGRPSLCHSQPRYWQPILHGPELGYYLHMYVVSTISPQYNKICW